MANHAWVSPLNRTRAAATDAVMLEVLTTENGVMGLSLEVVEAWVKGVTEPKQLDKLVALVERQRVVIADKVTAKAAKRKAAAAGG